MAVIVSGVAARTVAAEPAQWARVAAKTYERRTALDLTAQEVVERAGRGLSLTVLSAVENNRQTSYSARTLTALCRGLDWAPDSIDRMLRDEEPIEVEGEHIGEKSEVDRLKAEIAALRKRLDEQGTQIAELFGDLKQRPSGTDG